MVQELANLSGPRKALLAAAVLLPFIGALPWYRFEGQGFVVEYSGWQDLGVVAWILAIDLVAWELLRASGIAPVDRERGDRWSGAVGLLAAAFGGVFALDRAVDGALAWGWIPGTVLLGVLVWAALRVFVDARGPEAVAAAFGSGALPADEERPPPVGTSADRATGGSPGAAARSRPPWRRSAGDERGTASEDARAATGWPKTLAERQRDAAPLWADRDDDERSPRRPGRSG